MGVPSWSTFSSSGLLYERALAAFERIPRTGRERAGVERDALDAIVFAAFAVEGFLNEAPIAVNVRATPPVGPPPGASAPTYDSDDDRRWTEYASRLVAAEAGRAQVRRKLDLTCELLHGRVERGSAVYQNADLLLDVRDSLAHPRLEHVVFGGDGEATRQERRAAGLLERLRDRNILADPETVASDDPRARWMRAFGNEFVLSLVQMLCTRAVARWACDSAAAIVQHIFDGAPRSGVAADVENIARRFVRIGEAPGRAGVR